MGEPLPTQAGDDASEGHEIVLTDDHLHGEIVCCVCGEPVRFDGKRWEHA